MTFKMQQKSENYWYGTEQMLDTATTHGGTASLYITSYPSSPGICFVSGRFESLQGQLTVALKTSATGAILASFVKTDDLEPEAEVEYETLLPRNSTFDQASPASGAADCDIDLLIAVTRETVCQEAADLPFPCLINEQVLAPVKTTVAMLLAELNNVVLENSNFDFRVKQVGDLFVTNDFTENSEQKWMENALDYVLNPDDGVFDDLYEERERVQADLAVLVMSTPEVTVLPGVGTRTLYGIASPGWGEDSSQFAFITSLGTDSLAAFTFSHEFGHMMVSRIV
jgi:hypothetical protein